MLLQITMVATKTCFTVVDFFKPLYVKTHYKWPVMPKMARNRSALHEVLAQGASNRDITVSQNYTKIWKINGPWWKSAKIWEWSAYICMSTLRLFLCVLLRMPENAKLDLSQKPFDFANWHWKWNLLFLPTKWMHSVNFRKIVNMNNRLTISKFQYPQQTQHWIKVAEIFINANKFIETSMRECFPRSRGLAIQTCNTARAWCT